MSRENQAFIGATVAGVIVLFTIGLFKPHRMVEDGLVESLSAAGFAAASLLAFSAFLRRKALLTLRERYIVAATGGLSLLLFLSEISFGARVFDVQMPQMRGGGEFDGGHDVLMIIVRYLGDAGNTGRLAAAIGAGLFLSVAAGLLWRFRKKAQVFGRYVLSHALEFRLAVAALMLAGAVTLDLVSSREAAVLEEVLELSASGALILALSALLRQKGGLLGFGKLPTQGRGAAAPWPNP